MIFNNLDSKPSVLLVEDEPLVQKVHTRMIEKLGYKVVLAANGEQALIQAGEKHSLIFMDIGLPDKSGIDVTAEIRMKEKEKNMSPIPIIVITGYSIDEVKEKCLIAGANAVFNKPMALDKFKEILSKFISQINK